MTTTATTPPLPDAIEHLATDTLVPYARNSRTHSPEQVAQIAASIREFGFTNPVLIDGNNTLIAGHGRVMAAQSLGLAAVPCIRLGHLSDAQRRAYVIADNKLAEQAGWDIATLAREVEDLGGDGFDLELLGFAADELAALIGNPGAQPLPGMPVMPAGDRAPFRQMTFTLHDSQEVQITRAMAIAKKMGPFTDSPNENGNGNALARICETFITQNGQR